MKSNQTPLRTFWLVVAVMVGLAVCDSMNIKFCYPKTGSTGSLLIEYQNLFGNENDSEFYNSYYRSLDGWTKDQIFDGESLKADSITVKTENWVINSDTTITEDKTSNSITIVNSSNTIQDSLIESITTEPRVKPLESTTQENRSTDTSRILWNKLNQDKTTSTNPSLTCWKLSVQFDIAHKFIYAYPTYSFPASGGKTEITIHLVELSKSSNLLAITWGPGYVYSQEKSPGNVKEQNKVRFISWSWKGQTNQENIQSKSEIFDFIGTNNNTPELILANSKAKSVLTTKDGVVSKVEIKNIDSYFPTIFRLEKFATSLGQSDTAFRYKIDGQKVQERKQTQNAHNFMDNRLFIAELPANFNDDKKELSVKTSAEQNTQEETEKKTPEQTEQKTPEETEQKTKSETTTNPETSEASQVFMFFGILDQTKIFI